MFTAGIQNYYGADMPLAQPPQVYGNVNVHRQYRQQNLAQKMYSTDVHVADQGPPFLDTDHETFYEPEPMKPGTYCDLQPFGGYDPADQVASQITHSVDSPAQRISFNDFSHFDMDRFMPPKPLEQWQAPEVIDWIFQWAESRGIDKEEINTLAFNVSGQELATLSKEGFTSLDKFHGAEIYDELHNFKYIYQSTQLSDIQPTIQTEMAMPDPMDWTRERAPWVVNAHINGDMQRRSPYSNSDQESTSSSMTTVNDKGALNYGYLPLNGRIMASPAAPVVPPGMKKILPNNTRRGRPRKSDTKSRNRQGKGTGKLWEFIRDLLLNPATNPSLIRWERREEGIFKFVQSDKVAKMWGDRKQNPRMTYEKLSRAMRTYYDKNIIVPVPKNEGLPKKLVYKFGNSTPRYYYKSQVLLPVFGRRLVYKFGPNATGWRPTHPGAL